MLAAISELTGAVRQHLNLPPEWSRKTQDTAERRELTVMSTDLVGSRALDEARSRRSKSDNDREVL